MKNLISLFSFLFFTACFTGAQIITTVPALPVETQAVKIFYDATQGNQGLMDFTGDVYAHTGLITDKSTSGTDWKYTLASWTTNIGKAKMTRESANLYSLDITPSIREFYGVAAADRVLKMAFVFRSADRSKTGRTASGGDIFVDVFEEGLNVSISTPERQSIAEKNAEITLNAAASEEATLTLYLNETEIKSLTGLSITHVFQFSDEGDYLIRVTAETEEEYAADSVFVHVLGDQPTGAVPGNLSDGINYLDDHTAGLVLYAPFKEHVFLTGDFNRWTPSSSSRMTFDPATDRWWLTVSNLEAGKEYAFQYLVDGHLRIADPYTEKVLDPWNDQFIDEETYPGLMPYPADFTTDITSVLQTSRPAYEWVNTDFTPPEKKDLIIYELLLRDFIANHDWKTLTDTLNYLDRLGINAIELMPVNEFEGNLSWGYNPSFYFAPDKYYGPRDDLKVFIDSCHGRGIAVILDMVLNHSFGQSPLVRLYFDPSAGTYGQPTAQNPWYNQVSPNPVFSWGYDFNHESQATKNFVDRVNAFWLTEYRVDGFRFDFTKGFTNTAGDGWNYDAPRIALLKRMADEIWNVNPDAYVILEHFTANTEEKELAQYGMLIWGNMNYNYLEATMGYHDNNKSDLTWGTSLARGWNVPHLVTYMESHDEERLMYKMLTFGASSPTYNTRHLLTALSRMELATVFLLGIPGPKMIWQFGELGYPYSINYDIENDIVPQPYPDNDYARTGPKPIRWDYVYHHPSHRIYQLTGFMAGLRREEPAFSTGDYTYSLAGSTKRIYLNHESMNVTILGNFGVEEASVNPWFQHTGKWYEFFSGDSLQVDQVETPLSLLPGEYRLYTTKRLASPEFIVSANQPESGPVNFDARVFPNPSSEQFHFEITTAAPGMPEVRIFDISGKMIRQLQAALPVNGHFSFSWDGVTGEGKPVPSGLYLVLISGKNYSHTLRLVKQ